MKKKISITLSSDVLALVDKLGSTRLRSVVIEHAIRNELRQQDSAIDEADLELINGAADQLNIEAEDVLEYLSALRRE